MHANGAVRCTTRQGYGATALQNPPRVFSPNDRSDMAVFHPSFQFNQPTDRIRDGVNVPMEVWLPWILMRNFSRTTWLAKLGANRLPGSSIKNLRLNEVIR